jgi:hypothetical protein
MCTYEGLVMSKPPCRGWGGEWGAATVSASDGVVVLGPGGCGVLVCLLREGASGLAVVLSVGGLGVYAACLVMLVRGGGFVVSWAAWLIGWAEG